MYIKNFFKLIFFFALLLMQLWLSGAFFLTSAEARAGSTSGSYSGGYRASSSYSSGYSSYSNRYASRTNTSSSRHLYPSTYGRGYRGAGSIFVSGMILLATFAIILVINLISSIFNGNNSSGGLNYSSSTGRVSPSGAFPNTHSGLKTNSFGSNIDDISRPDLYELKERVRLVFFQLQKAWSERNQFIAENYMSQRLFYEHKRATDEMIKNGERNILKNINIIDIKIIDFSDACDSLEPGPAQCNAASMKARIRASMIDYRIDANGEITAGDEYTPDECVETWVFIMGPSGFVADEIIPS